MSDKALITGGSRGIGYALAESLARRGYDLLLVARDKDRLDDAGQRLIHQYEVNVDTISQDLAENGASEKLHSSVKEHHDSVDILINNAGFGDSGSFYRRPLSRQSEMIQVNIQSLIALTHLFLNDWEDRTEPAYILNVASTAAFQPGPYMSVYYASKSFVYSFSEALNVELKNRNIIVSALCPGPTATDFHETAGTSGRIINNSFLSMSADKVAEVGLEKMFLGKSLIIPGFLNKMGKIGAKLLPRKLLLKVVTFIHQSSE